jgi:hypothetical protein
LDELNNWLGEEENGAKWRRHLKWDELNAELAKGAQADRATVANIAAMYGDGARGLEMRRFQAVREALAAWLAEFPQVSAETLPQAARDAKQHFAPTTEADVARAKQDLSAALKDLDRLLARAGVREAGRWKKYLRWEELEAQLAAPQPDRSVLVPIAAQYFQNEKGLDLPAFLAAREALDRYADAILFSTDPNVQKFYADNLEELAKRLETYVKQPKTDDAIAIGRSLGWLQRFGQAQGVAEAVRSHYWRPNLFLEFSEQMMKTGIETDVDEQAPVREVILGTTVRGTARMTGQVSLDLVPDQDAAAMDLVLRGTTYSNNVGYNGPVKIYSRGVTSVDASKRVSLDKEGLEADRARAACRTRTTIRDIQSHHQLVERIAWNRARQSKSRAEAIASQRAARRVAGGMDARAADLLDRADDAFSDKFRKPLIRRGAFPAEFDFQTTDQALHVVMLQADDDQLGAPNEPPAVTGVPDIGVRFHESLVGNLSQAMLGDVTLTDVRVAEMVKDLTGSVPDELAITQEKDPWSITFVPELPVEVRMDDQSFKIVIRGKRFTRSDQEIRRLIEISASYKVEKTPEGAKLTRQGDLDVNFVGLSRLSVAQVTMKTFIRKKFESLLKAEIVSDGLALPGRWKDVGKFRLDQLYCDDGWLALSWLQPKPTPQVAAAQ